MFLRQDGEVVVRSWFTLVAGTLASVIVVNNVVSAYFAARADDAGAFLIPLVSAAAMGFWAWRLARVSVRFSPEGLTVRNLATVDMVGWDEVAGFSVVVPKGGPTVGVELRTGRRIALHATFGLVYGSMARAERAIARLQRARHEAEAAAASVMRPSVGPGR